MIQLVALDVDDTLTESDGSLLPDAIDAVRYAAGAGAHLVLISSRPPEGIQAVRALIGVNASTVSYAGALIQDAAGRTLRATTLGRVVARDIALHADQMGLSLTLAFESIEFQSQGECRPAMTRVESVESAVRVVDGVGAPILIGVVGQKAALDLYEYCRRRHAATVAASRYVGRDPAHDSATFVDIKATKGDALRLLMEHLRVPREATLAIGDSEVDLSMLEVAGVSVAVFNADQQVKSVAGISAPEPRGRGVAWAIGHLMAGQALQVEPGGDDA